MYSNDVLKKKESNIDFFSCIYIVYYIQLASLTITSLQQHHLNDLCQYHFLNWNNFVLSNCHIWNSTPNFFDIFQTRCKKWKITSFDIKNLIIIFSKLAYLVRTAYDNIKKLISLNRVSLYGPVDTDSHMLVLCISRSVK